MISYFTAPVASCPKALWPQLLIRDGGKKYINLQYASKTPQFCAETEAISLKRDFLIIPHIISFPRTTSGMRTMIEKRRSRLLRVPSIHSAAFDFSILRSSLKKKKKLYHCIILFHL